MTTPVLNQPILLRITSTRTVPAVVTKVIDDDTVDLVAFADISGAYWAYDGASGTPTDGNASWLFTSVVRGTGVGNWQDAVVSPAVSDAIASAVASGTAGLASMPSAGTSPSIVIGTPRQPNTARSVRVSVSGTWTGSLSVTGSASGTIELRSDAASTPTTPRLDAQAGFSATLTLGLVLGQTIPWSLNYDVPAGHYYVLAISGGGTFAITRATEQVL